MREREFSSARFAKSCFGRAFSLESPGQRENKCEWQFKIKAIRDWGEGVGDTVWGGRGYPLAVKRPVL